MNAVTKVTRTPEIKEEVYDVVCPVHGKILTGRRFTLASQQAHAHDRFWKDEH